jgi:hypothetical protein
VNLSAPILNGIFFRGDLVLEGNIEWVYFPFFYGVSVFFGKINLDSLDKNGALFGFSYSSSSEY